MVVKRKDCNEAPVKNKKIRQEKASNFSDDEDLSDIDEASEIFNGIRIPAELPPIMSAEEDRGPRMIITNIVANNFKSYYGEVNIGPFHKSLTSIVGANGSGKSNVIDSLLFVFGYRSTKIRSKKVSVLLHKSDKHKDVNQCSVTVNFVHIKDDKTQGGDFIIIPDTEIKITRTAFKDNTSFYTLNNKRVKFKEIATILKKNGIDLVHNRFLILQGEVEQIAMMKPKAENEHSTGMLEYLEDVIGTVRYKKPILRLEEKLKEISLEKNEKVTRMKFVRKEREELVEPAEATIRVLKLQNQIAQLHNKEYQRSIHKITKLVIAETEEKNKIEENLNSIENEFTNIAESKKGKVEILRCLNEKLKSDIKKYENLEKKYKNIISSDTETRYTITQKTNQIKKFENSIKQEKNKIIKAKCVPEIKETELKQLQSQLEPLKAECLKLEENYSKINSNGFEKSKKFREEKELLAPEELKLQKLVGSKQNQFQTLKTEFEVLLDTEKSEREKLSKLEEQLTKGSDDFQENKRIKEKAEEDLFIRRDTIKDLEKSIEKLKNDEEQIKIKLQTIRQSLTEKRTAYAETTERSRPIQYILNLKEKGDIHGVLGRCGDYGQVEENIDIPASTACGSTDHIVVETSDAAHACIQKLRQNNIGRLTFSILPQIQKYKILADKSLNYPENAKRVFDLVQILDQRFRLTFYSGLFDTLLANDLEQARRIAFGTQTRYRVVTYKGDLIDQSGIMSGGGRPIKGKIGPQETKSRYAGSNTSQVSQNEVEKLDKIVKDLEVKLMETQSKIFDYQTNIEQHRREIEELNLIVKQCSSRINMWKEKENQVINLIEDQKLVIVKKKTDPVAVANKEDEIKKAEKELEEANEKYNKIKSEVDSLKKQIEQITVGEPKEAMCLLNEANNKLEKTLSDINQVNVDINAADRQIKKSEGQIKILTDDINEFNENINSLNQKLLQNDILNEELGNKMKETMKIINEQKENIEEIKNKEDETNCRTNELRKDKIKLTQNFDEIKSRIRRLEDEIDNKKDMLSKLMLHKIPNIDNVQRDPIMESYQNSESNKQDTENLGEKNSKQMQIDEKEKEDDEIDPNRETFIKYSPDQLNIMVGEIIREEIVILTTNLNGEKPNFNILEEYQKRTQQYNEKANEVAIVLKLYNEYNFMINKVRQRRRDEFMISFKKITIKLKEMYQMITLGGDAELELVDSLDPFSEGVNFSVRPPKKTWKVISNLSGGEKTLSSLALVFALHYYKPSPLYVMDEIDAALDFKNVSIIAYYIKERTKNSQFIIISLRSNMFEKSNLLVGIYKTNDCTATIAISSNKYNKLLLGQLKK